MRNVAKYGGFEYRSCNRFEIKIIGVASKENSMLLKASTIKIILPQVAEADKGGLVPTSSTTMMLAFGDALAVALMYRKKFNSDKCTSLLKGYQKIRVLTSSELDSMTILLKGAAMRILLTRLHDILYHSKEALVSPKDPKEYLYILNFYNTRDPIELISEN